MATCSKKMLDVPLPCLVAKGYESYNLSNYMALTCMTHGIWLCVIHGNTKGMCLPYVYHIHT